MPETRSKRPPSVAKVDGSAQAREYVDGVPRLLVLGKAMRILDAFTVREPELSVAELTSRTGLPSTTCFRLVRNLASDGLLERNGDRYRIGLAVIRWASSALEGRDLLVTSRPTLDWLRDESGESSLLCVRDGASVVLLALANSRHSVARHLNIGEVSPLHAGSTGKVFLAFDPEAYAALPSDRPLEAVTARTITDRRKLEGEMASIRSAGFASSIEEKNIGAVGITAPVFDIRRRMVAAVGLTGPAGRMGADVIGRYSEAVRKAASEISAALGYAEPDT
jgi:IclR family transcriptional regulator, acetate operon repressor